MRFLIDAMLPPSAVELLADLDHDAVTPPMLGAHDLPDDALVLLAAADGRVVVTENASDFALVTDCPVVLVRKSWWPTRSLAHDLASALDRWARANPDPGPWAHWFPVELRSPPRPTASAASGASGGTSGASGGTKRPRRSR